MPEYIIVAGINGAGKSTLFEVYPWLFENTQRINADEILRAKNGDWHKSSDNLAAMRIEVSMIKAALSEQKSLHVETTLAGNGHAQKRYIEIAHANGFTVTLLYVALSSPLLAVNRVMARVSKGGHGIPTELILKRYQQSLNNLPLIAQLVDNIKIFENDDAINLVYARDANKVLQDELVIYPWLPENKDLLMR